LCLSYGTSPHYLLGVILDFFIAEPPVTHLPVHKRFDLILMLGIELASAENNQHLKPTSFIDNKGEPVLTSVVTHPVGRGLLTFGLTESSISDRIIIDYFFSSLTPAIFLASFFFCSRFP